MVLFREVFDLLVVLVLMVVLLLSVMLVYIPGNIGVGGQLEMNGLRNLEGGGEGEEVARGAGNYGRRGEIVN